ncbi:MAG: hypothetical protein ACLGHA_09835 [Gammaproteobacteria bacterium]
MMKNSNHPLSPWTRALLLTLLAGAGTLFPVATAVATSGNPKPLGSVQGIHVQRTGDTPWQRDAGKMMIEMTKAQCGSPVMKQTCQTMLSDPAASLKAKARCQQMMLPARILGNSNDIGQVVADEYFAPALGRSVRIVKTIVPKQAGVCEVRIEQEETREIAHYRANGYTRYVRKTDKSGQPYWLAHEHSYVPGMAGMLKTALDAAQLGGKVAVSAPLGNKTLVPGRTCETRRVSAGAVEFVSCIHATGLKFPSHVRFESEVFSGGKTSQVEKLSSYKHDVVLSRDLFFPDPREKAPAGKNRAADSDNPTRKWCAAEKARTGVDPCKDDDE